MTSLEWRHPNECQFGDCDRNAVVDVAIQGRGGAAFIGGGAHTCSAHVGVVAELLLEHARLLTTQALEELEVPGP